MTDLREVLLELHVFHLGLLFEGGEGWEEVGGASIFEVADSVTRMLRHTLDAQEGTVFKAEQVKWLGRVQLAKGSWHFDNTVRFIKL